MKSYRKGIILVFLSALGFGLLPIFAVYSFAANINVTTLLFIRFSIAAALLFTYVFIKFKKITLSKRDIFNLLILGMVLSNLQSQFYFTAIKYIKPSLAALILYTYPMMVTALAYFFDKEKITKKVAGSIGISFVGLVMILGTSIGTINGLGILFALGAALVYSIYIVFGNRVVQTLPSFVMTSFITLFTAMGLLGVGLFSNSLDFNFSSQVWLPLSGLIIFSTVGAMVLFLKGLEYIGPAKTSVISTMEAVFTVVFSTIIFHERLSLIQIVGGVLVLIGGVLIVQSRAKKSS